MESGGGHMSRCTYLNKAPRAGGDAQREELAAQLAAGAGDVNALLCLGGASGVLECIDALRCISLPLIISSGQYLILRMAALPMHWEN